MGKEAFDKHIQDAFTRSDKCLQVYIDTPFGRTTSNVFQKLETAYIVDRLRSGRKFLKDSEGDEYYPLVRIRNLVEDVLKWEHDGKLDGSPDIVGTLASRFLANRPLRSLLDPIQKKALSAADDDQIRHDLLSAVTLLGQLHIVHELLADQVPTFMESLRTDAFRGGLLAWPTSCAARFGHIEILKALLASHLEITKDGLLKDEYGIAIIQEALEGGHLKIIEYLLGDDIIFRLHSYSYHTLLSKGVECNNMDGILLLLENIFPDFPNFEPPAHSQHSSSSSQPSSTPQNSSSPTVPRPPWSYEMSWILNSAATLDRPTFISFALSYGGGEAHSGPDWIFNPISSAARNKHLDIMTLLLNANTNKSLLPSTGPVRGWHGQHPFAEAVRHDHLAVIRLLLDHGATPDICMGAGWGENTPLGMAVRLGRAEIADELLSRGASLALAGSTRWMKRADRGRRSVWNEAFLMATAAYYGWVEVIKVLGRWGVSPSYPYATRPTREKIVTHDPMLNALRRVGMTVGIGSGVEEKGLGAVRALVELGADEPGVGARAEEYLEIVMAEKDDKGRKRGRQSEDGTRRKSLRLNRTRSEV